jgi:hypothetical protein
MILTLYDIPRIYEAGEIIFYKKELYKISGSLHNQILNGTVVAYDIFGNAMTPAEAAEQLLAMVDSPAPLNTTEAIFHNMEVGKQILSLWREYVIIKSAELGITGQGITQLQNFYLIECALLAGMLYEAAQMTMLMPEDQVITAFIKQRFATACNTADRLN